MSLAVANSRDVADLFGRQHKNLLRSIGSLLKNEHTPAEWYVPIKHTQEQNGQDYVSYDMTRDGFTLLVMGFTGEKAHRFKLAYIKRFNEMEEQIKSAPALPDFSNPAAAARALPARQRPSLSFEQANDVQEPYGHGVPEGLAKERQTGSHQHRPRNGHSGLHSGINDLRARCTSAEPKPPQGR